MEGCVFREQSGELLTDDATVFNKNGSRNIEGINNYCVEFLFQYHCQLKSVLNRVVA